jgi:hypothetical protein
MLSPDRRLIHSHHCLLCSKSYTFSLEAAAVVRVSWEIWLDSDALLLAQKFSSKPTPASSTTLPSS